MIEDFICLCIIISHYHMLLLQTDTPPTQTKQTSRLFAQGLSFGLRSRNKGRIIFVIVILKLKPITIDRTRIRNGGLPADTRATASTTRRSNRTKLRTSNGTTSITQTTQGISNILAGSDRTHTGHGSELLTTSSSFWTATRSRRARSSFIMTNVAALVPLGASAAATATTSTRRRARRETAASLSDSCASWKALNSGPQNQRIYSGSDRTTSEGENLSEHSWLSGRCNTCTSSTQYARTCNGAHHREQQQHEHTGGSRLGELPEGHRLELREASWLVRLCDMTTSH